MKMIGFTTASMIIALEMIIVSYAPFPFFRIKNTDESDEKAYQTVERSSVHNKNFNCLFMKNGKMEWVSTLHDIPLQNKRKSVYNMVVENPRWTTEKMVISKTIKLNPICEDVGNDRNQRLVANIFPSFGYPWNFGKLPQTWLNPFVEDERTNLLGDNGPVDVLEIGGRVLSCGQVIGVKLLGAYAVKVGNLTNWKAIAIAADDANADAVNDVKDVRALFPGLLEYTEWWLRTYKMADYGPENELFEGRAQSASTALAVVNDAYNQWKNTLDQLENTEWNISLDNTTLKNLWSDSQGVVNHYLDSSTQTPFPATTPPKVDRWYYPSGANKNNI